jgi:hypothetical protein
MRAYGSLAAGWAALSLITVGTAVAVAAPTASTAGRTVISWGKAEQVPGTGVLNAGGQGQVEVLSCPAAGDCVASGFATAKTANVSFLTAEHNRRWGKASPVPGLAKLDVGGQDYPTALSCSRVGYCAMTGGYIDGSAHVQPYVVTQSRGKWGTAREVPGVAKLNAGGHAGLEALSCPARGSCAAVGDYQDGAGHYQAFVVVENRGAWSGGQEAPGSAALNAGGSALLTTVTCTAAGSCVAGGYYTDKSGHVQPFVIMQTRGHWGKARVIPGIGKLNAGGNAEISSVSCSSAGNCAAGGFFSPTAFEQAPLIVTETKGKWGKAEQVPGAARLNSDHHGELAGVSCARTAGCGATGYYETATGTQSFVVSQQRGRWGAAKVIPGLVKLNKRGFAEPGAIACAAGGSCTTGGFYFDGSNHQQVYVATERNGRWGTAIEVPGSGALNKGFDGYIYAVACASAGNCSVGGLYQDSAQHIQPFVANETARLRRG